MKNVKRQKGDRLVDCSGRPEPLDDDAPADKLLEKEAPALDQVLASANARLSELTGLGPPRRLRLDEKSLEELLADVKAHRWKLIRKGR